MSLRKITIANLSVGFVIKIFSLGLSLINQTVLPIILTKYDYGLAATALIFLSIATILGDFGLGTAVIQRKTNVKEAIETGATLRLMISLLVFSVVFITAPFTALFFGDKNVTVPIWVISFSFIFMSAGFIAYVTLMRELKIKEIFITNFSGHLVATMVMISLALLGFGYWSIVTGSVISSIVTMCHLYYYHPWKLTFRINKRIAKELFGFSKFVFGIVIFGFIGITIDKLLVGRLFGVEMLGIYWLAWRWATFIIVIYTDVVGNVMFPTFSSIEKNIKKLVKTYYTTLRLSGMFFIPILFLFSAIVPLFVPLILGYGTPKWNAAIVPMQILTFYGIFGVLIVPAQCLCRATGRVDIEFYLTIFYLTFIALLIYPVLPKIPTSEPIVLR